MIDIMTNKIGQLIILLTYFTFLSCSVNITHCTCYILVFWFLANKYVCMYTSVVWEAVSLFPVNKNILMSCSYFSGCRKCSFCMTWIAAEQRLKSGVATRRTAITSVLNERQALIPALVCAVHSTIGSASRLTESISRTQFSWPLRRAKWSGVIPKKSSVQGSAPAARNNGMYSCRPTRQAMCRAVRPFCFCNTAFISDRPPLSTNVFTLSNIPFVMAATILRSLLRFWHNNMPSVSSIFL